MASLISSITEGNRTSMDSRTNVELNGEPFKTFKFKTETLEPKIQASIIYIKNIGGDTLIWGNDAFGIWGSFKWGNSARQSFILGLSQLGINTLGDRGSSFSQIRIVPPNDTFEEQFVGSLFIDTTSTNASIVANTGVIF